MTTNEDPAPTVGQTTVADESQSITPADAELIRRAKATGTPQKHVDPDAGSETPGDQTQTALRETGVAGIGVLHGLISATFFHDLFCHQASARFRHSSPENRVAAMIEKHPNYYRLCRYSDFAYRFIAACAVLGGVGAIAVGSIYKVFFS